MFTPTTIELLLSISKRIDYHQFSISPVKLTFLDKGSKAGCQNREDGVNFRKAEVQVHVIGTREPYFPNSIHIRRDYATAHYIVITVRFSNQPL